MDTIQLDSESRLQMRVIALETAVEQFGQVHTRLERLGELEARIKVLEEARIRQIAFNIEVSNRLTRTEKPVEKVIKFWPWK